MSKIKIVTDSTCDLPSSYFTQYDIAVIPVNIHFGTEMFLDGVTLSKDGFYQKLQETGLAPKTSLPSVGQFVDFYRRWASEGFDTILSLHITAVLSGILNAARLAAQEVASEVRVIPFDSLSGSAALGFMCVEAQQMARAGKTVEEILARLNNVAPRVRIELTLATLKYAAMSGRISNLQSTVASLLSIKPIVIVTEGRLLIESRFRSRQAALNRVIELTKEAAANHPVKLAVLHAQACDEAEELMARARESVQVVDSFMGDLTTSIAAHFGPGAVGTVVYPAD